MVHSLTASNSYGQLNGTFIVANLLASVVFGQTAEDVLKSKLTSVHYARLAEMARIQGDVRLKLNNGLITVISGHPLLAPLPSKAQKRSDRFRAKQGST
jgi:hypothetical protein